MSDELHIASFIVLARPESLASVVDAVRAVPVAEIAACEGGKLIVLVEASCNREVMAVVDCLRDLPGVLAVNLVYHHADARDLLSEEIPDEHTA
jgi:nitrate reductase NapD